MVGRWEDGVTQTGPAFSDFVVGSLSADRPKGACHWHDCAEAKNGKTVEDVGLDDGVTALQHLGLIVRAG